MGSSVGIAEVKVGVGNEKSISRSIRSKAQPHPTMHPQTFLDESNDLLNVAHLRAPTGVFERFTTDRGDVIGEDGKESKT